METSASPHQPLRSFAYRLTQADVLAYASLKQELTVWGKLRWLTLIVVGGILAGILPESLSALWWWVIVFGIVIMAAIFGTVLTKIACRYSASRMKLPSGDILLEVWGDHLFEQSADGNRSVALEQIAQVIPTAERLFIRIAPQPVIIPASAFQNDTDMGSFAQWLDEASERAQP